MWFVWMTAAWAGPDVVMVGNSYTDRNDLELVIAAQINAAAAEGVEPHALALLADGSTWSQHVGWLESRPEWAAAFAQPQDFVILQEQSQTPGFPQSDPAWQASRDAAIALHQAATDAGAQTVLFLTWGRRDGDADNPSLYPDYPTMQDRLEEGYRAVAAALDEAGERPTVAPVGEAWRAVYEAALTDGDALDGASPFVALYAGDGSHPSPAGTWLAATVLTTAITGREPVDLTLPDVPLGVRQPLMAAAAAAVFDDPFGPDGYTWAMSWDAWYAGHNTQLPISEPWRTPWVRVDGAVQVPGLIVGGNHDEGPGEARLVVDGGALQVDGQLVIGGAGRGWLHLWSGSVDVGRLLLGDLGTGQGEVTVDGGRMTVDWLDRGFGSGKLLLRGGTYVAGGPIGVSTTVSAGELVLAAPGIDVGGDLSVDVGATVRLSFSGEPAVVGGALTLDGSTLIVDELVDGRVLFDALTISATAVATPLGWRADVVDVDGRQELVLFEARAHDPEPVVVAEADEGCGCRGVGGGTAGWLVAMGLLRRRGRTPSPDRRSAGPEAR